MLPSEWSLLLWPGPPEVISVAGPTSVEKGGTLELTCTATGSPLPTIQVVAQSNHEICKGNIASEYPAAVVAVPSTITYLLWEVLHP